MRDQNFIDILKIINTTKDFDYWISYGSLLGLIRGNELIEWDGDVDICIRRDSLSYNKLEAIADQAHRQGFKITKLAMNYQFYRSGGRKIDINILDTVKVGDEQMLDLCWEIYFVQTKFIRRAISKVFRKIDEILPKKMCVVWRRLAENSGYYGTLRYRTKADWVEETFDFQYGTEVAKLPKGYDKLLQSIYGPDWHISRKSKVWHEFAETLND